MDICENCGCDKSLTNDKKCPMCGDPSSAEVDIELLRTLNMAADFLLGFSKISEKRGQYNLAQKLNASFVAVVKARAILNKQESL